MKKALAINCVEKVELIQGFRFNCLDPFLFCVYHKDLYPAGNEKMEAPRKGNGADFNPSAPYRMYHGDRIPGFPQHPHRGFETITATMSGTIDHTDSMGNAGRYGDGDLQWMTAGKGIVHGENFPLIKRDAPNTLRLFQIWLNLPAKSKMVDPAFVMHWSENIPTYWTPDSLTKVTLWAGTLDGKRGLDPPPNSWAANPESDLAVILLEIGPSGSFLLPAATGGSGVNRMAYFIEGDSLSVNGATIKHHSEITLKAGIDTEFKNIHNGVSTEVLILQGRPIGEPVVQHGPFVMNTQTEIQQAFADYRRTQFGGWPWEQDAAVFPRTKGRFALLGGVEELPPVVTDNADTASAAAAVESGPQAQAPVEETSAKSVTPVSKAGDCDATSCSAV